MDLVAMAKKITYGVLLGPQQPNPSDMVIRMDIVHNLWQKTKQNPDLAFLDPHFGPFSTSVHY